MKTLHVFAAAAFTLALNCTPQGAKTATDVVTTVADATCKALEAQVEAGTIPPDYVMLECAAEGVASGIVKVLLPKALHTTLKTMHGPAPAPSSVKP